MTKIDKQYVLLTLVVVVSIFLTLFISKGVSTENIISSLSILFLAGWNIREIEKQRTLRSRSERKRQNDRTNYLLDESQFPVLRHLKHVKKVDGYTRPDLVVMVTQGKYDKLLGCDLVCYQYLLEKESAPKMPTNHTSKRQLLKNFEGKGYELLPK